MKRPDYFSSYYVSIGRTGFNLKICPALAKVTSSVSQMKVGKSMMLKQTGNFRVRHSEFRVIILEFQVLKPSSVRIYRIEARSTAFRPKRAKCLVSYSNKLHIPQFSLL